MYKVVYTFLKIFKCIHIKMYTFNHTYIFLSKKHVIDKMHFVLLSIENNSLFSLDVKPDEKINN